MNVYSDMQSDDPFVVRNNDRLVEVWSQERLPFEPKGWLVQLRDSIRLAVKDLDHHNNSALHASYISPLERKFDIENILFYNVGISFFSRLALNEIIFERSFSKPPIAPNSISYNHYHRYSLEQSDFKYWEPKDILARWSTALSHPINSSTKAHDIWYLVKRANIDMKDSYKVPQRFGISVTLTAPVGNINLVSIMKPMLDGVIAAFQSHQGVDSDVYGILARKISIDQKEVERLLHENKMSVLGSTKLLHKWGTSIQWAPSDAGIVAASLSLVHTNKYPFGLSGHIFVVEERF